MFAPIPTLKPYNHANPSEPWESDLYDITGVKPDASGTEILEAYQQFKSGPIGSRAVDDAFGILSNPATRICYNSFGSHFQQIEGMDKFKAGLSCKTIQLKLNISIKQAIVGGEHKIDFTRMLENTPNKHSITLCIPAGSPETTFTIFKHGHQKLNKVNGDVQITVVTKPSDGFARRHNFLLYDCHLPIAHLFSNAPFQISHPSGQMVTLSPDQLLFDSYYTVPNMGIDHDSDMIVSIIIQPFSGSVEQAERIQSILDFHPITDIGIPVLSQTGDDIRKQMNESDDDDDDSGKSPGMMGPGCPVQ